MAEIYNSADVATLATLSQEAAEHINRVLADLGLDVSSAVAVQAADATSVTADPGDQAIVALTSAQPNASVLVDDAGHSVSVILAQSGSVHLTGSGDDTVFASDGGNTITAGEGHSTIFGGTGSDSIFGGTDGGSSQIHSGGGHDTLAGGNGMDTLWGGSDSGLLLGGQNGQTVIHAGTGGDTIQSHGGFDTIFGGHASITETGGNTLIYVDGDVVSASGNHDVIDGSASTHASRVDVFGHNSTILGGAGNDTITLHDASSGYGHVFAGAGNDTIIGSMGGHATLSGGAGDDYFQSYGLMDSMLGGDGSDVFGIVHAGIGQDTIDGGGGDDSVFFQDRSYQEAHISSHDASLLVTFNDGYSASLSGIEQLHFKDTVYGA